MKRIRRKIYNSPRGIPQLDKILNKLIADNPEYKKLGEMAELLSLWPKVVGDKLAKISRVIKFEASVLIIKVNSSIWRSEFYHIEDEIKNKYNAKLGYKKISKILFY
ncbi:MAG: DUF721 domain-containing protein [Candidatus Delongbacteria bacterium]|jgi:hypothetical protein|nr:DUF721 domain-containing protein [Candidatus Delongbacteria bacterium]